RIKPNFRSLGQKGMGKQAQELKKTMGALSDEGARSLVATLLTEGKITVDGIALDRADLEISFAAKEGYAAAGDRVGVEVLDTRLTDELRDLGYLRELLNRIQTARKDQGLEFTDRIRVELGGSERARRIAEQHKSTILRECLAVEVKGTVETGAKGPEMANDL